MAAKTREIKQDRKMWGDEDTHNQLRKISFKDDTYCLRWDIYAQPKGGGEFTKYREVYVENPYIIAMLESFVAIIQYADAQLSKALNAVIDSLEGIEVQESVTRSKSTAA